MKYVQAKELVGTKFSFKSEEQKHSLKTNYEWHKLGRPFGFFVRDNETNQLKKWNKENKTFVVEDENQYWYENDEGARKCYLTDVYGYIINLNGEETQLNLTWTQNKSLQAEFKRVEDDIGISKLDAMYTCTQIGRGYAFQYSGNKGGQQAKIVIPTVKDDRTPIEVEIVEAVKASGNNYTYEELTQTFTDNNLTEERSKWLYETYLRPK